MQYTKIHQKHVNLNLYNIISNKLDDDHNKLKPTHEEIAPAKKNKM